jgi:hypothetical protein
MARFAVHFFRGADTSEVESELRKVPNLRHQPIITHSVLVDVPNDQIESAKALIRNLRFFEKIDDYILRSVQS